MTRRLEGIHRTVRRLERTACARRTRPGAANSPRRRPSWSSSGYGAVWLGGNSSAANAAPLLDATSTLRVGTSIQSIWQHEAADTAAAFAELETAHPGRFLLGLGVSHAKLAEQYRRPYSALVAYLDALDAAGVPADRRLLAALGPKTLELSRDRSAGAIPYLVTPEHTAQRPRDPGRSPAAGPRAGGRPGVGPDPRPHPGPRVPGPLPRPPELHQQLPPPRLHGGRPQGRRQRPPGRRAVRLGRRHGDPRPRRHVLRGGRGPRGPADRERRTARRPAEGGMAQAGRRCWRDRPARPGARGTARPATDGPAAAERPQLSPRSA